MWTQTGVGSSRGLGYAERLLEAEERTRRTNRSLRDTLTEVAIQKVSFVVSSFGGLGLSAREFLNKVYCVSCATPWCYFLSEKLPALNTTWNAMTLPTFWDARVSLAGRRGIPGQDYRQGQADYVAYTGPPT
jgi:hypothetical protein